MWGFFSKVLRGYGGGVGGWGGGGGGYLSAMRFTAVDNRRSYEIHHGVQSPYCPPRGLPL